MIRDILSLTLIAMLALPATSFAQKAADTPSPELIQSLSKELGSTSDQSIGAAGALFGLAKSRLKPADFAKIATAVPGMGKMLAAAPALAAATGSSSSAVAQASAALGAAGGAGGLASMASSFSKLGLKPELVAKAVPVLVQFVSKSGGAGLGSLLGGVLK